MDNMTLEKQTSNLGALQQHNQGMIKIKILRSEGAQLTSLYDGKIAIRGIKLLI